MAALLCLSIFATACYRKPPSKTREQAIQERLDERLARWEAEMVKGCVKRIEEKAIAIVDSTIIANAKANRDTAGLPYIPSRPEKPDFVPPPDTQEIKPLLQPKPEQ